MRNSQVLVQCFHCPLEPSNANMTETITRCTKKNGYLKLFSLSVHQFAYITVCGTVS